MDVLINIIIIIVVLSVVLPILGVVLPILFQTIVIVGTAIYYGFYGIFKLGDAANKHVRNSDLVAQLSSDDPIVRKQAFERLELYANQKFVNTLEHRLVKTRRGAKQTYIIQALIECSLISQDALERFLQGFFYRHYTEEIELLILKELEVQEDRFIEAILVSLRQDFGLLFPRCAQQTAVELVKFMRKGLEAKEDRFVEVVLTSFQQNIDMILKHSLLAVDFIFPKLEKHSDQVIEAIVTDLQSKKQSNKSSCKAYDAEYDYYTSSWGGSHKPVRPDYAPVYTIEFLGLLENLKNIPAYRTAMVNKREALVELLWDDIYDLLKKDNEITTDLLYLLGLRKNYLGNDLEKLVILQKIQDIATE